jgi:hypothetical protein
MTNWNIRSAIPLRTCKNHLWGIGTYVHVREIGTYVHVREIGMQIHARDIENADAKLGEEVETANWLGKCIDMKPNGPFYAIASCAQTTPLDEVTVGRSDSWTK